MNNKELKFHLFFNNKEEIQTLVMNLKDSIDMYMDTLLNKVLEEMYERVKIKLLKDIKEKKLN